MIAGLCDRVSERELGTLQSMEKDETRIAIDAGIAQIIGLPTLAPLRTLLGQEPVVSGDSAMPSERADAQLEFELL